MSKSGFTGALFEQLGGVNWVVRAHDFPFAHRTPSVSIELESHEELLVADTQVESLDSPQKVSDIVLNETQLPARVVVVTQGEFNALHDSSESIAVSQQPLQVHEEGGLQGSQMGELPNIVVLGAGLDAVWQDETNQAWQLWQNIMLAFDWDERQIAFFDTLNLVSEEVMFSTMEEIIELGVDWVLTMDESHEMSEMLQEGVSVIAVPELESMLSDPYSKQSFYQTVMVVNI